MSGRTQHGDGRRGAQGVERRRRAGGRAAMATVAALAMLTTAACDEQRATPQLVGSGRDGPTVGATPGADLPDMPAPTDSRGPRQVAIVQIAAFPDSAAAARLRDSLAAAGWRASIRPIVGDSLPRWRVRVVPTVDRDLLQLVAEGWRRAGRTVQLVGDTASPVGPGVRAHLVNLGGRGRRGQARWTLGPGGRALLVVEDAGSADGTPAPDAFVLAADARPGVVQRDSVWDVAPDPTWTRVAFGRAFVIRAEGRDAMSAMPWLAVAARTNMNPSEVRRGAFSLNRDETLRAFAQPVIEPLAADSAGQSLKRAVTDPVPMAGGWRVRWSADGRTLVVGLPPSPALTDDAAPRRWLAVDAATRLARGEAPGVARTAGVRWSRGATFDSTSRVPAPGRVAIPGGEARGADGWITVRGAITGDTARVIGPGTPFAATAGGRFIAALAPAAGGSPGEPGLRVVVYELVR